MTNSQIKQLEIDKTKAVLKNAQRDLIRRPDYALIYYLEHLEEEK